MRDDAEVRAILTRVIARAGGEAEAWLGGGRHDVTRFAQNAITQHVSKIVFDQSNVPGTGYIAAGPNAIAKASNVPITDLTENVPITSGIARIREIVSRLGRLVSGTLFSTRGGKPAPGNRL